MRSITGPVTRSENIVLKYQNNPCLAWLWLSLFCVRDRPESEFTAVDTMAATACAILVLLNSTAFSANMLVFRIKIIGMTGGAEGCVLRVGPAEHRVDAVTVTAAATQIPSVVTRIVVYVSQRFGCRIATIHVTLVAVTGAAGIMNPDTTYERGGGVAG